MIDFEKKENVIQVISQILKIVYKGEVHIDNKQFYLTFKAITKSFLTF